MRINRIIRIRLLFFVLPIVLVMQVACHRVGPTDMVTRSDVTQYDDLELIIQTVSFDCVKSGDPIQIRFTVKNAGRRIMTADSIERPALDIAIGYSSSSEASILWSAQNPAQVVHHLVWQPGESKTIEMTWIVPGRSYSPGQTIQVAGWLTDGKFTPTAIVEVCLGGHVQGR